MMMEQQAPLKCCELYVNLHGIIEDLNHMPCVQIHFMLRKQLHLQVI